MKKVIITTLLAIVSGVSADVTIRTASMENVSSSHGLVELAVKEIDRYTWLRTGERVTECDDGEADIVLTIDSALGADAFTLKTVDNSLTIRGGTELAVLYGTYRYAELLGVSFYIHGDVIPDGQIPFKLPEVDESHNPLFEHRGIQPFHDFTEGPDWWSLDDYKAYLGQMAKMRMNWIGLHCYPEGKHGPEPLVWIGLPEDVNEDGTVKWAYPSGWASTRGQRWGYADAPTSEFAAGAGQLFTGEEFGASVNEGYMPTPATPEGNIEVFNRTGHFLNETFRYADALGIHTVIGTEAPLTIPAALKQRMRDKGLDPASPEGIREIYRGMMLRIKRAHPLGTYWLWTPEGWTWGGNNQHQLDQTVGDMKALMDALHDLDQPFDFGTCGWVLGPVQDRSYFDTFLPKEVTMACISRAGGSYPVETGFASIEGRPKWAIPWMEADATMILPQLWVGRTRRDAADALAYGCTGLMGIHWRTKIMGPNFAALADAAWDQSGWNTDPDAKVIIPKGPSTDYRIGGRQSIQKSPLVEELPEIYHTMRWNADDQKYVIHVPNGTYDVILRFCDPFGKPPGSRTYGVELEGKVVAEKVDVIGAVGPGKIYDLEFKDLRIEDESLNLTLTLQNGCTLISGISISGHTDAANQIKSKPFSRHINIGGGAVDGYEADLPDGTPVAKRNLPRTFAADDFYRDWCKNMFGATDQVLADLFTRLDNGHMTGNPPVGWGWGPGMILPKDTPWEEFRHQYDFIDELEAYRPKIKGKGNLARFDYWLNTARYIRAVGKVGCARGALDAAMEELTTNPDKALKLRIELARAWEQMITFQLAATDTPGEMGTIANLEQHVRRCYEDNGAYRFMDLHDKKLEQALGKPLPAEAEPTTDYLGAPRIIVPTVRSSRQADEKVSLNAIVLAAKPAERVVLHWRNLGEDTFKVKAFKNMGRSAYVVELPLSSETVEYTISALNAGGTNLYWPATAPERGQTMVAMPKQKMVVKQEVEE